jgi:hypothetical protein
VRVAIKVRSPHKSVELKANLLILVLRCGHTCPSPCGEICPEEGCPQCASGTAPPTPVLICPSCKNVQSIIELDRRVVGTIYTTDESGNITGFRSGQSKDLQEIDCYCGVSFDAIRRYSITKDIRQASAVFDQLLAKLGEMLGMFSRRLHFQEKELDNSFHMFRHELRPNPLAANHNRALVTSRAQDLLKLADNIQSFNISTATTFEGHIGWLQENLPAALSKITSCTIHPTLSLRFTILHRRARNIWIADCLRVSKFLVGLEDPSLEVQRMGEVLRIRASKECWQAIAECEEALAKAVTTKAPAIEVEIRLQQIHLNLLLDIALTGFSQDQKSMPSMSPEAPTESLEKAKELGRQFPDTAGRYAALVHAFTKYTKSSATQNSPDCLSSIPRTYSNETRKTELAWAEHVLGGIAVCARAGHPYSKENKAFSGNGGCPECGREKAVEELSEGIEEEARKAGKCLFEDQFLAAMKGMAK